MEMKNVFEGLEERKLTVSGEKIKQNERNAMKAEVMAKLMAAMAEAGLEVGMTADGIAVNVQNAELGSIVFAVDMKVKDLGYDFYDEVEAYNHDKEEKAAAKAKREEAKKAKIARDAEARKKAAELKAKAEAETKAE